jgi:uncharacterized protein (TIGR02271 family)
MEIDHEPGGIDRMPTLEDIQTWRGRDVVDSNGDKIGTLEDIYLDRNSGEPEWAAIRTGLFGTKVSFAPLRDASPTEDEIRIPYDKSQVKDAPNVEADGELSPEEEQRLYQHYGRSDYGEWDQTTDRTEDHLGRDDRYSTQRGGEVGGTTAGGDEFATAPTSGTTSAGTTAGGTTSGDYERTGDTSAGGTTAGDYERTGESATTRRGPLGDDVSGPETDEAMTRSEEELDVGTARRETGRARLRKYVVTENVTQTVPVEREEVRIEREPITDANVGQATDGPAISEEEHEVTLHADEPVVEKRAVPKERVRLDKETVTDEETVSEDVRKEQIEGEGGASGRL